MSGSMSLFLSVYNLLSLPLSSSLFSSLFLTCIDVRFHVEQLKHALRGPDGVHEIAIQTGQATQRRGDVDRVEQECGEGAGVEVTFWKKWVYEVNGFIREMGL